MSKYIYIVLEYENEKCRVVDLYKSKRNAFVRKTRLNLKSKSSSKTYHIIRKDIRDELSDYDQLRVRVENAIIEQITGRLVCST